MDENEKTPVRGGISIELEHIFPIIKKWLYSDKEIFLREIVSNACDAITKLRRLNSLGEADVELSGEKIWVELDKEASTITVIDNGIGMTKEEVEKYICQIALSGALDFIQKYEGSEADAAQNGIIGHFGLGFYSAFMVSDRVEIITRSYQGGPAVKWTCGDDGNYEITEDYDDPDNYVPGFGTAV
ncbi:MAG: ATP-binding protein, partial [Clostridia bacterium]|nr:ATP-binding protein [Clostridia bacterium]